MNLAKILTATIVAGLAVSAAQAGNLPVTPTQKISGPYSSSNLSVFLIHGTDTSKFQKFLTLQEALQKGVVTVKETGDVNQLSIQNKGDQAVFVQSGDIVKGGRQDRTMQYDMIVPPKSGVLPIKSFCVEHDRWSQRGVEDAATFQKSNYQLANKNLKMAAKYAGDQSQVWQCVDRFKSISFAKAKASPVSASPSSLQLALENEKMRASTGKYVQDLSKVVDNKDDVIGYAFAINGKVNSVDVYGSNALFKKMWPKLIASSATEALTESDGKKFTPAKVEAVTNCMNLKTAPVVPKSVSGPSRTVLQENKSSMMFETQLQGVTNGTIGNGANVGQAVGGGWIHRNYMTK